MAAEWRRQGGKAAARRPAADRAPHAPHRQGCWAGRGQAAVGMLLVPHGQLHVQDRMQVLLHTARAGCGQVAAPGGCCGSGTAEPASHRCQRGAARTAARGGRTPGVVGAGWVAAGAGGSNAGDGCSRHCSCSAAGCCCESDSGAPDAAVAAAATQAERAQAAAVPAAESKRLVSLDAALAALPEDDAEAVEALRKARAQCAARIADTQPLGKRLAAARRAHTRATADLARAEEAARLAAQRAQAALEAEHRLAAQVQDLEKQVSALQGRQTPEPALVQARFFLEGIDAWLADLGLSPPAELQASAAVLREALPPESEPSPDYSPTDLAAPLTPTEEEAEEDGTEELAAGEEDVGMRQKREADDALALGPAARPKRDAGSGPYARPPQRAASR